ncbi:MAG TPA: hypothetical protein VJS43_06005 [Candidatus Acidoferrales bacterium]|nr:hypothetical protein [Candidatus Acidoferrales bacterium]
MKLTRMFSLLLLSTFSVGFGGWCLSTAKPGFVDDAVAMCSLQAVPSDVKDDLSQNFASWKIQEPNNLSDAARERWNAEKPLACPGIAVGRFANASLSYAFLLVSQQQTGRDYRFIVFDRTERKASFDVRVLANSGGGAHDAFIRRVQVSEFADQSSRSRFLVYGIEGILFVDASTNEYESDLYFWNGRSYEHSPIDY